MNQVKSVFTVRLITSLFTNTTYRDAFQHYSIWVYILRSYRIGSHLEPNGLGGVLILPECVLSSIYGTSVHVARSYRIAIHLGPYGLEGVLILHGCVLCSSNWSRVYAASSYRMVSYLGPYGLGGVLLFLFDPNM